VPVDDYLPDSEDALKTWYLDFEAAAQTHGTTVGWSAAEKLQATANLATLTHAINGGQLIKTDGQEWTAYKDILLYAPLGTALPGTPADAAKGALSIGAIAGIIPWTRQIVGRTKKHPLYTIAIGQDFGVIGPAQVPGTAKPDLSGVAETDFDVRLLFSMKGYKSIEIQRMRGNEADFSFLAIDTGKPYVDGSDPLVPNTPETRRYRARYRDNDDNPIGDWSDVVTIVAKA
jgi:hypothetical protein